MKFHPSFYPVAKPSYYPVIFFCNLVAPKMPLMLQLRQVFIFAGFMNARTSEKEFHSSDALATSFQKVERLALPSTSLILVVSILVR